MRSIEAVVTPAVFYTYVVGGLFLLVLALLAAGAAWGAAMWVRDRMNRRPAPKPDHQADADDEIERVVREFRAEMDRELRWLR